MGQAASPSLYDYAHGDPVNFVDPDGRCPNNGANVQNPTYDQILDAIDNLLSPNSQLVSQATAILQAVGFNPYPIDPINGGQNPENPNEENSALGGTIVGSNISLTSQQPTFSQTNGRFVWPVGITVPPDGNGVVIQQVTAHYLVTDSNGNLVQSGDTRINGSMSYTYFEYWQVNNGQVGVTVNGTFNPGANTDTIGTPGWPSQVASGSVSISTTMVYVPNGSIPTQSYQDVRTQPTSLSGNLPVYDSSGNPPGWNPSGGATRQINENYNPATGTWGFSITAGKHP